MCLRKQGLSFLKKCLQELYTLVNRASTPFTKICLHFWAEVNHAAQRSRVYLGRWVFC